MLNIAVAIWISPQLIIWLDIMGYIGSYWSLISAVETLRVMFYNDKLNDFPVNTDEPREYLNKTRIGSLF